MINTFAHPYLLFLLLLLIPVLIFAWKKRSPVIIISSLHAFKSASKGKRKFNPAKFIPFLLYALAAAAVIFAMSQPREGLEEIRRRTQGIDIIIALDLSGSMAVYDAPSGMNENRVANSINSGKLQNRLETAKKEITSARVMIVFRSLLFIELHLSSRGHSYRFLHFFFIVYCIF